MSLSKYADSSEDMVSRWIALCLILFKDLSLFYVWGHLLCLLLSVYHMLAWCLQRPGEGVGSPGPGVTDVGEPLCGY